VIFTIPKKRRHPGGFALSALVHCGLAYFIVSGKADSVTRKPQVEKRYSVLLLHPEDFHLPRRTPEKQNGEKQESPARSSTARSSAASPRYSAAARSQARAEAESAPDAAPSNLPPRQYRQFVPPTRRADPVKQTLVQTDVPPDIHLPRDLALPTLIVWTPTLPKLRKTFVMPAVTKPVKASIDVPTAPDLSPPNMEPTIADLKLAALPPKSNPKLFRPPASTAPIQRAGPQLASSAPLIVPRNVGDAPGTSLLSLPDMPVRPAQVVAIPPANQIAAAGGAGPGHAGANGIGAGGTGSGGQTAGQHSGRALEGHAAEGGGSEGRAADDVSAVGRANGFTGASGSSDRRGPGVADGASDAVVAGALPLAGTIRIELPKEGKFGVVVSGSSAAAPYAESVGALSGRMIYSVYLKVGLRKNWILQYCLPSSEEQKTAVRGRADPLDAPWPYFIVRPDNASMSGANADYILVHGTITSAGRFDKLAMVFPADLKQKDLLMRSLQQWTFRPASRDGVAADVEVLLIIPNAPE